MRKTFIVLGLVISGFFPSFAQAATADINALQATVAARELAFSQSMADQNIAAFADFISAEAVFFNGNDPIRSRDAIVSAWSVFFQGAAPFSWLPDVVSVLDSGSLALSSGPVLNPAGEEIGRFNSIWRLEADGQWRVIFDKGS